MSKVKATGNEDVKSFLRIGYLRQKTDRFTSN